VIALGPVDINSAILLGPVDLLGVADDTTAPVLTLVGASALTHTQGDSFTDLGANWTDNVDGSGNVGPITPLDVNTLGTQILMYSYTDVAGNISAQVTRAVTVVAAVDTENPVLNVNGASSLVHTQGEVFIDKGASWTDNFDGAGIVFADVALDVNALGTQLLIYNYTDEAGNEATPVTRSVTVQTPVEGWFGTGSNATTPKARMLAFFEFHGYGGGFRQAKKAFLKDYPEFKLLR